MIDYKRYKLEKEVFQKEKLPEAAYRFIGIGTDNPYLRIAARTNSGKIYTLHIELSSFPESIPEVYVTKMLKDSNGKNMSGASAQMHTLTSSGGWTRICHYGYNSWTPMVSLFKIYVKCRLWLEAYEAHFKTGNTIDTYLVHQS